MINWSPSSDVHYLGNNTGYDAAVKSVYPVLLHLQGNKSINEYTSVDETGMAHLLCLQADEIQTGSRIPNAASRSVSSHFLVVAILGASVYLML